MPLTAPRLAQMKKTDRDAQNCVRYDRARHIYELVIEGAVKARMTRFAATVPGCRKAFDDQVKAHVQNRRTDALVDRLFPDGDPAS